MPDRKDAANQEAAAASAAANTAAQQATAEQERLKQEAAEREKEYQKAGKVIFEYSVREHSQESEILSKEPGQPIIYGEHRRIIKEKGSREALPRPVAERKQRQGLGKIVGEDSPYDIQTMRDVVIRDPLAPANVPQEK